MGAKDPVQATLRNAPSICSDTNSSVDTGDDARRDRGEVAMGEHSMATEADVKELVERQIRDSVEMENVPQQSSRRHQQDPKSPELASQSKRQDLLDKVESLTGEISESLLALTSKDKDNAIPEKSNRPTQNTAGPQSAYLKPALSPISEDGPLDERGAWEVHNSYEGHGASPYTHGILLPDWQIWAEQVSQLLNRFSSEISILTSRVEWIDQRLRSPDSEVPSPGQSDAREAEDSAESKMKKPEDESSSSARQQRVAGITAEIPSSPLVPLTPNLRLRATDSGSPPSSSSAPRRSSEGMAIDLDLDLADKIEVAYVTCLRKHIPVPVCWTAVDTRERGERNQESLASPKNVAQDSDSVSRTPQSLQGSWEAMEGVPHVIVTDPAARKEVLPEPPQLPAPRMLDRDPLSQIRTTNVASGQTNAATSATALAFPEPNFGSSAQTKASIPRTSGLTTGHVSPCMPAHAVVATKAAAIPTAIAPMVEQRQVVRPRSTYPQCSPHCDRP